jgi:acetyl-CoA synthetase
MGNEAFRAARNFLLARRDEPNEETAQAIFGYSRKRLAPYKRIRRLEFGELPKTSRARSAGSSCESPNAASTPTPTRAPPANI